MSTQTNTTAAFNPRDLVEVPSYTIVINERQLYYIRLALREFVANDPGEELDEFGMDIPTVLEEMIQSEVMPSPAINAFVL